MAIFSYVSLPEGNHSELGGSTRCNQWRCHAQLLGLVDKDIKFTHLDQSWDIIGICVYIIINITIAIIILHVCMCIYILYY